MPKGIYKHKPCSEETKRKISESNKGKKLTKEHKRKISEDNLRNPRRYWLGKKMSKEHRKKISEVQKGEKNWNWKGGISDYPYPEDWTKVLKRSIRERDKYVCQLCNKLQEDRLHAVHHIDYNKNNCNPNNLITLCGSCHIKTNYNREYWIEYFNELLNSK